MGSVALQGVASLAPSATVERDSARSSRIPDDSLEESRRVLFVTSEIAGFVKVGGLGDVSSALPRALTSYHDVRVLVPAYREMVESGHDIEILGQLPAYAGIPACDIGKIICDDGLILYVLLCPDLYEREGNPYCDDMGEGWSDNDVRFARLSLAAAEIASNEAGLDWCPELLHLNDWPSGLAAAYLHWRGCDVPSVFTIHNLAYQGESDPSRLDLLGIPASAYDINGVECCGRISFLKAGIVYASQVTTVSENYAREITTPEFGCGLEGLLATKAEEGRLSGIPNGIDDSWNPRFDPHLAFNFAMNDWRGKRANAQYVRRMFGLAVNNGPLFAVVSRLVHQKGLDLTVAAAESIVRAGGQIVFIGRGERAIENALSNLAARFPGAIGVHIGFDEGEARCIYAGSDFLLMPSRFEPCGLSQMYAQRFGSLPIAHRTGGLADTIEDGVTGFLFDEMSIESYMQAIDRAVSVFNATDLFYAMRRAAMANRYQWREAVKPYNRLYRAILDEYSGVWLKDIGLASGAGRAESQSLGR